MAAARHPASAGRVCLRSCCLCLRTHCARCSCTLTVRSGWCDAPRKYRNKSSSVLAACINTAAGGGGISGVSGQHTARECGGTSLRVGPPASPDLVLLNSSQPLERLVGAGHVAKQTGQSPKRCSWPEETLGAGANKPGRCVRKTGGLNARSQPLPTAAAPACRAAVIVGGRVIHACALLNQPRWTWRPSPPAWPL